MLYNRILIVFLPFVCCISFIYSRIPFQIRSQSIGQVYEHIFRLTAVYGAVFFLLGVEAACSETDRTQEEKHGTVYGRKTENTLVNLADALRPYLKGNTAVYERYTAQERQKYGENTVVKHRSGLQWNTEQTQLFTPM